MIAKIKDQQGNIISTKEDITEEIRKYANFYSSATSNPKQYPRHILNVDSEEIPEINKSEIRQALKQMKSTG